LYREERRPSVHKLLGHNSYFSLIREEQALIMPRSNPEDSNDATILILKKVIDQEWKCHISDVCYERIAHPRFVATIRNLIFPFQGHANPIGSTRNAT
jgi:hypothetical protein